MDHGRELDHLGTEIHNISTHVVKVGASAYCPKEEPKVRLKTIRGEAYAHVAWREKATTLTSGWEQCTALLPEGGAAAGRLESRLDEHNDRSLHTRATTGEKVKFAGMEYAETW